MASIFTGGNTVVGNFDEEAMHIRIKTDVDLLKKIRLDGVPVTYSHETIFAMAYGAPELFSHDGAIVAISIGIKYRKLYRLDFEPIKIDRNLSPPRLTVGADRYAVITADNAEYFDDIENVLAVCDTDFAKLLYLEARLRGIEEHLRWMPGGPGALAAASSFGELAKK